MSEKFPYKLTIRLTQAEYDLLAKKAARRGGSLAAEIRFLIRSDEEYQEARDNDASERDIRTNNHEQAQTTPTLKQRS